MNKGKKAFVFYESFFDALELMPEKERMSCLYDLVRCGFGKVKLEDIKYPNNAIISHMLTSVGCARERYNKSKSNGSKGGRPVAKIDRKKAELLYSELGSWKAVGERLGVSKNSLLRARKQWAKEACQKSQNLNINNNTNTNTNTQINTEDNKLSSGINLKGIDANIRFKNQLSSIPPERLLGEPFKVGKKWFVEMIDDEGRRVAKILGWDDEEQTDE